MALPKKEEEDSPQTLHTADVSRTHCAPEPALEERAPKFLGWEKVLHLSQPSGSCWGDPPTDQNPKAESGIKSTLLNDTNQTASLPSKDPYSTSALSATQALALVWLPTPLHGFSGVTACLHTPELIEVDLKAPVGATPIRLVATLGISSVSSSHIVKDEIMGITYMDTVTTSIGRVTISGPDPKTCFMGPTIEDITDLV